MKAATKIIFLLILSITFLGCSDNNDDDILSEAERKAKMEQILLLENDLILVKKEIAEIKVQMEVYPHLVSVLKIQLQDKMIEQNDIIQKIQRLKKELGLK